MVGNIVALVAFVLFVGLLVTAMRRARARRRAEFSDAPPPHLGGAIADAPTPEAEVRPDDEAETESTETDDETDDDSAADTEDAGSPDELAGDDSAAAAAVDPALARGLERTRSSFFARLGQILSRDKIDATILEELETALLTADVGVRLTTSLIDDLRGRLERRKLDSADAVRRALAERLQGVFADQAETTWEPSTKTRPAVVLFVGVNGVGKTTTIGKIAARLRDSGKKVVLAAGDTFRAAAAEQLTIWAERTGAEIVRGEAGADPASVVFNAISHAKQVDADVVLCDSAGRLHTKSDLMEEIKKVKRACSKARDGAPDETWIVVDATTGQNALQQAREFHSTLGLTGVILTKLDGTAKGGVVVAIADAVKVPVRFVGVGEQAADLRPFSSAAFVKALTS